MNKTVQQMARAMLDESGTPATFWGEAAYAAVVILNKTNVQVNSTQNPHELWYGKTPSVKHFKIFGSKCYIKNTDEQLGNLNPEQMKVFSLVILPTTKCISVIIKDLEELLIALM